MNGTSSRNFPAPSLRELSSESETEGVYFGERNRLKISEFICADGKPLAQSNHRTTLPQRGSRDGVRTIQRAARKP